MDIAQRIDAFDKLGLILKNLDHGQALTGLIPNAGLHCELLTSAIENEYIHNPWFIPNFVKKAMTGIAGFLEKEKLHKWAQPYGGKIENPKRVGLVMAGNIPLVGFHDMLCVVMSGHICICKPSSKDYHLLQYIVKILHDIEPQLSQYLVIEESALHGFDAIIATGSDNSARYFNHYFGKYPHIIRKNRNSIAILDGNETIQELNLLADDIFLYFGLGCRNVSKVLVPQGYDIKLFFEGMEHYGTTLLQHHKYMNNYEYNRSVYLMNSQEHFDNGFVLLKKDQGMSSPLAVVFYSEYASIEEVGQKIALNQSMLQCIVANLPGLGCTTVPFGMTQSPGLTDYADNIDTMAFLHGL